MNFRLTAASLVLIWPTAITATSIVLVRSADGNSLAVASDSLWTPSKKSGIAPETHCKISRISSNFWVAIAGVSADADDHFFPHQMAIEAGSHYPENLAAIVEDFRQRASELFPVVMEDVRAAVGEPAWERDWEGQPDLEAIFFGLV